MYRLLLLTAVVVLITGCQKKQVVVLSSTNAFYYWQTSLRHFDWHDSLYQALHVKKVYCRFFDVDWNAEAKNAIPVSPLELFSGYQRDTVAETVPVVFITNETFKSISREQSIELARLTYRKIMSSLSIYLSNNAYDVYGDRWGWRQDPYIMKSARFDEHKQYDSLFTAAMAGIKEIQFDCDWTAGTKDNYFAFLEEVQKLFAGRIVSATIRLYQYKYPDRAGIPPVKRGMLMCYNAGNVKDLKTTNSIFDKREVMSYLEGAAYSLPLDYALPVFEWALLYQNSKLTRIIPSYSLREYESFLEFKDNRAEVLKDFVYGHNAQSTYVRRGDVIRMEQPDMDDVNEVAGWLAAHKNNTEAILALYHLNDYDLQKHSKAIETIFDSF